MATKAQPEMAFDMSKYFPDMNKYVGDFKAPNVDMDALMATQRRNIEAIAAANRMAVEAMQAVFKRQTEILRQALEDVAASSRDIAATGSLPEKAAKQTELAKQQFERGVANMRELSELFAKSSNETADLLNKRFVQSLDEVRDVMLKMKG